jgi:hypothetical protein
MSIARQYGMIPRGRSPLGSDLKLPAKASAPTVRDKRASAPSVGDDMQEMRQELIDLRRRISACEDQQERVLRLLSNRAPVTASSTETVSTAPSSTEPAATLSTPLSTPPASSTVPSSTRQRELRAARQRRWREKRKRQTS